MSNWIDIEILPPKEEVCANKILCKTFVILPYFEDDRYYVYKESFEPRFPNSIYNNPSYDWAISNNATEIIYKYKYE